MKYRKPDLSDDCIGFDVKIQLTDGFGVNKNAKYPIITQALSGNRVLFSTKVEVHVAEQTKPMLEVNFRLTNAKRNQG